MRSVFAATAVIALASCGGPGGVGGGSTTFQPGQWEMTTQLLSMSVPNMPQGAQMPLPPPQTVRHCMTEQEAASPGADLVAGSQENSGCQSENMSFANGQIQGTVQCSRDGANMQMTLSGQYTPTTMEMNQQIRTQQGGMNMEMEARTTGRRIGDCPSTT